MMLRFFVLGTPVAKGRPRAFRLGGGVRMFTPKKTQAWETLVERVIRAEMGDNPPLEGELEVHVLLTLPVPASWPRKAKEAALNGLTPHISRPDVDNLAKAVLDACNGSLWVDDCQITRLTCQKEFGETPGVTIEVLRHD